VNEVFFGVSTDIIAMDRDDKNDPAASSPEPAIKTSAQKISAPKINIQRASMHHARAKNHDPLFDQ
jgi:hypothetical protein